MNHKDQAFLGSPGGTTPPTTVFAGTYTHRQAWLSCWSAACASFLSRFLPCRSVPHFLTTLHCSREHYLNIATRLRAVAPMEEPESNPAQSAYDRENRRVPFANPRNSPHPPPLSERSRTRNEAYDRRRHCVEAPFTSEQNIGSGSRRYPDSNMGAVSSQPKPQTLQGKPTGFQRMIDPAILPAVRPRPPLSDPDSEHCSGSSTDSSRSMSRSRDNGGWEARQPTEPRLDNAEVTFDNGLKQCTMSTTQSHTSSRSRAGTSQRNISKEDSECVHRAKPLKERVRGIFGKRKTNEKEDYTKRKIKEKQDYEELSNPDQVFY